MTPLPLSDADLKRLGKFLAMLGSNADTERAMAGAKADALLKERGSSWGDLIDQLRAPEQRPASCHRNDARECLAVEGIWNEKERSFLLNMCIKRSPPTASQAKWLARLLEEARACSPGATL